MKRLTVFALTFVFFAMAVSVAFSQSWDTVDDWSTVYNPNGVWSYGRTWDVNVSSFDIANIRWDYGWYMGNWGHGGPSFLDAAQMWAKDNSNGYPVIRWTAPDTGLYQLIGSFSGADSRGVDNWVYVTVNNVVQFQDRISSPSDSASFSFNNLNLNQGDTIDFMLTYAGGVYSEYGWTLADATIAVAPEPISSTLFIVGGLTLGFRCHRKKFKK
jgi:hypothetical protein